MASELGRRSFLKAAGSAAAAATTTSVAGCLGSEDAGGTIRYGRGNDSSTLDPQATTSGEDAKVMNQIYNQLVEFQPGGATLTEGLATDWTSEGSSATLTLREDATFHNGEEFTADDFIATYRRFLDEEYDQFVGTDQSIYGPYLMGNVENVEATGDYEISFELASEYAPFVRNLAVFALAVLSKAQIESDEDIGQNPVGTGPFQFDEWDTSDQVIRLSAFDDYWGDGPNTDQLLFEVRGENTTRAQALDADELDIIDGLGAQAADQVEGYDGSTLKETPGMNVGYMAFNMARMEPFRDKRVRKAVSHAIDTKAIVENIYRGLAVQSSQPIPPGIMGHDESLDPYEHDQEKAQQLLEEADYGDGFEFELATMNNPRPYFPSPKETAETVKSNLADVGIEVTINEQSWESYLTYTGEGKHDACFLGWITDNADPDNFYSPLLHPGLGADDVPDGQDWVAFDTEGYNSGNRAAWANTDFMKLVKEGKTTFEPSEREEIYQEATTLVHDEAPWVFVTHTKELRGVSDDVQDFSISPVGGPALHLVSKE